MPQDSSESNLLFVVRATNIIETRMKSVIADYLEVPGNKRAFAEAFLLNNSIIPLAAKAKLTQAIADDLGLRVDRNALHILLSRRNAFAHQDHLKSIRVITGEDGIPDVTRVVESIKGSGNLEVVSQDQAFVEFVSAYHAVERDLDELSNAVRQHTSE